MSKIQEYTDAKVVSDEIRDIFAGIVSDERTVELADNMAGSFAPLSLRVKLSPTAGAQLPSVGKYLAQAILNELNTLMVDAQNLAEADTETARLAAVAEAHEVLQDLT